MPCGSIDFLIRRLSQRHVIAAYGCPVLITWIAHANINGFSNATITYPSVKVFQ